MGGLGVIRVERKCYMVVDKLEGLVIVVVGFDKVNVEGSGLWEVSM